MLVKIRKATDGVFEIGLFSRIGLHSLRTAITHEEAHAEALSSAERVSIVKGKPVPVVCEACA